LNKIMSDELNDFESFVDAYLVLKGLQGTQPEDIAKMKQDRVLLLADESSAEWLVKNVNNAHIKELKETYTTKIRELGCIPDIENLGSFGASGVALKFKLISTEIQASKQERTIQRGIQRKLELLYNILRISDPAIGNYTDVEITFERNFIMLTDDILNQKRLDLALVDHKILSRETFLQLHKGMTPDEANAELRKVGIEADEQFLESFPPYDDYMNLPANIRKEKTNAS